MKKDVLWGERADLLVHGGDNGAVAVVQHALVLQAEGLGVKLKQDFARLRGDGAVAANAELLLLQNHDQRVALDQELWPQEFVVRGCTGVRLQARQSMSVSLHYQ